jgi:hypothetical protein
LTASARYHLSTNIDRIQYQSERERITQALLLWQQAPKPPAPSSEAGSGATATEMPPENNE